MRELGKYQFSLEWKLGSGLTSDAYMGKDKENQQMVCVKVLDLQTYKT